MEPRKKGPHVAASREGKIVITAYLPASYKRSLRLVQADTGQNMQELLAEALDDLFRKRGAPIIK